MNVIRLFLSKVRHRWRERSRVRRVAALHGERLLRLRQARGLLLDIGGGTTHLPGWVTLDIEPDADSVPFDASKRWPLQDESARAVRAEHMIEHLDWQEATTCIREMYRVLEPGGICRICTPDLEGIARAYLDRDPRVLQVHRGHGYDAPTWSHLPNNYLRLWGHRYMFDFDALRMLLEDAGFAEVERTAFNRSRHELFDGSDSHDPEELESLVVCVDAVKR
jgi:predicted SAM-dependent methyltransferase